MSRLPLMLVVPDPLIVPPLQVDLAGPLTVTVPAPDRKPLERASVGVLTVLSLVLKFTVPALELVPPPCRLRVPACASTCTVPVLSKVPGALPVLMMVMPPPADFLNRPSFLKFVTAPALLARFWLLRTSKVPLDRLSKAA